MAETILVTGGTGFVGARVVDELVARGGDVVVCSRGRRTPDDRVRHVACDLLDDGEVSAMIAQLRPARLVHCAWSVEHGAFWQSPGNARWADASARLFARFFEAGGRHATALGSCAEYDWRDDAAVDWSETRAIAPATPYGVAKARACAELLRLARCHGAGAAWARLFFLFGPGEDARRLVPSVVAAAQRGGRFTLSRPHAVRDYAGTRYVGAAIARLSLAGADPGAVNVASGEARTLGRFARDIARLAGDADAVVTGAAPSPALEPARIVADISTLRRCIDVPDLELTRDLEAFIAEHVRSR
jgi:nucleoside-diphosphate-sugar epimerase